MASKDEWYKVAPQQWDAMDGQKCSQKTEYPQEEDIEKEEDLLPALPSKTITLRPLKAVGKLQQRYSEATADVVFVGRERLPAHRAVLSVASAVFFKMFEGNWKESKKRSISVPPEYKWEAFKAAITLLYGVEVQVDESSVLDVYRVAHCYDLVYVTSVLAHAISQWGRDMLDTVLELCALVGQLETEKVQKKHEMLEAGVVYIAKHLAQVKMKPAGFRAFPHQAMLKVVQSEDISVPEGDVFLLLKQWMDAQPDITLRQAQELYSHIRYGIFPYESLSLGVNQENLDMTLQNHQQLSMDRLKKNLKQITPRLCQDEVLQVYPLVAGLSVLRKGRKWEFVNIAGQSSYTVGVIYSGRHELAFRVSVAETSNPYSTLRDFQLNTQLSSICEQSKTKKATAQMDLVERFSSGDVLFLDYTITLKPTGVLLVPESRELPYGAHQLPKDFRVCRDVDVHFKGPFPWILKIAVGYKQGVSPAPRHQSVSMVLQ